MLRNLLITVFLCWIFHTNAQISNTIFDPQQIDQDNLSLFEHQGEFQTSIINFSQNNLSFAFVFGLEDEIAYTETNQIVISDCHFFNLNLSYTNNPISIVFALENLGNLRDSDFALEPNTSDTYGSVSYESNFFLNASIVYEF